MITVYTKQNCPQCRMTEKYLDRLQKEYSTKDLEEEENLDYVLSLGFKQAPVVIYDGETATHAWTGFRPDLIDLHFRSS